MGIKDIARTDVVTVDIETPVPEIAQVMRDERVGSVVVLDGKDTVSGMITDRDIVTFGFTIDEDPRTLVANDLLATNVFSVPSDAGVNDVIDRMAAEGVRRVPVVDGGDLVGIVTLDDLVLLLSDELGDLASVIRSESPP